MNPLPEHVRDLPVILSISGGKDSTATMLWLIEHGIEHRRIFADTGFEADETYAYLDLLRARIGPIEVVRADLDMIGQIRKRVGFPARMQRWCTRKLKLEPLHAAHRATTGLPPSPGKHDRHVNTLSVVGMRSDESEDRKLLPEWDDDVEWGGWVWRPLIAWKVTDVLAIHHRHGVPVNPLYKRGHGRVGCYPCIYSTKEEIRLLAEHTPERVAMLADLEREIVAARAAEPQRFEDSNATFFQGAGGDGMVPIETVVAWSKTSRGGRQLPLLVEPPRGGCYRWGMCDPPAPDRNG